MTRSSDAASWWQSFFLIWGPWIVIFSLAAFGALVVVILLREYLLRRHQRTAVRTMYAALVCAVLMISSLIVFTALHDKPSTVGMTLVRAACLLGGIASLLGAFGFGGYTVWRLIHTLLTPATESAAAEARARSTG